MSRYYDSTHDIAVEFYAVENADPWAEVRVDE